MNSQPESHLQPSVLQAVVFALCFSGYPFIAIFPIAFDVETQLFTIPNRAVVLGLALLTAFSFIRRGDRVFRSKFWIPFIIFWVLYSVRLFYEIVISENSLGFKPEDYLLFTYGITLGPAIAFAFPPSARTLLLAREFTFWLTVTALIGNVAIGWESMFVLNFSRFNSDALNAVSFAALGSIAVLIALTNLIADPQPVGRNIILSNLVRATYVAGIVLGVFSIYISASRGPMLATCFSAALLAFVALRENLRQSIVLIGIVAFCGVLLLYFGTDDIASSALFERLRSIITLEDRSDTERLALWENGFEQFLESPLLGSGLEEKTFQYYPHNIPLEAYMTTGVIGGSCFMIALMMSIFRAFQALRFPAHLAWLAVLFLDLTFMSLLAGSIWTGSNLTQLMLAIMAMTAPYFHRHNWNKGQNLGNAFLLNARNLRRP